MWPRRLERSPVRSPIAASGHDDLDVDDRFQHDRLGGADGLDHRLAPGGDEGDFLAVDRMGLAVEDGHSQVVDRVTGDHAVFQPLAHALFDRRHEDAGNDAALDRIDELEAGAASHRLDPQIHLAELAGAAALLLVAAWPSAGPVIVSR